MVTPQTPARFLIGGAGEHLPLTALAWHGGDSSRLTSAGSNGFIKMWDAVSGRLVGSVREQSNEIFALDYMPGQQQFVSSGSDAKVRVYDTERLVQVRSHGPAVGSEAMDKTFAVKCHPTAAGVVVTGGWGGVVRVWDLREGAVVREIHGPKICGDALDVTETQILTGSWTRDEKTALQVWDYRWEGAVENIALDAPDGAYLYCAQFGWGGRGGGREGVQLVAAGGSGTHDAQVFERRGGVVERAGRVNNADHETGERKAVQTLDFSPSGGLLGVAGVSPVVTVVKLDSGRSD